MISDIDANKIDEWLRKFQKEHDELKIVDDNAIESLARALYNDIPFGYEASIRLANWLFCHLNQPHISKEEIDRIDQKFERQKYLDAKLNNAYNEYNQSLNDIIVELACLTKKVI